MEAIDFLKGSECLDTINEFCDAKEDINEGVRERASDHYLLAEFVLFQEMKRLRSNQTGGDSHSRILAAASKERFNLAC